MTGKPGKKPDPKVPMTPERRAKLDAENEYRIKRRAKKKLKLDMELEAAAKQARRGQKPQLALVSSDKTDSEPANHSSDAASIGKNKSMDIPAISSPDIRKRPDKSQIKSSFVSLEYPPEVLHLLRSPTFWQLQAQRRAAAAPWQTFRKDEEHSLQVICEYVSVASTAGFQMLIDRFPGLLELEQSEVRMALDGSSKTNPFLNPRAAGTVVGPILRIGTHPPPSSNIQIQSSPPRSGYAETVSDQPELYSHPSETNGKNGLHGESRPRISEDVEAESEGLTMDIANPDTDIPDLRNPDYVLRSEFVELKNELDKRDQQWAIERTTIINFISLVLDEWPKLVPVENVQAHLAMQNFRDFYITMEPSWHGWRATPVTEKLDILRPDPVRPAPPGSTIPVVGVAVEAELTDEATIPEGFSEVDPTTWPPEWGKSVWKGGMWKYGKRVLPSELAPVPENPRLVAFIVEMYAETTDIAYLLRQYDNDEEQVVDEIYRHAQKHAEVEGSAFALFVEWCRAYARDPRRAEPTTNVAKTPHDMLSHPGIYLLMRTLHPDQSGWATPTDVLNRMKRHRSRFVWGVTHV